MSKSKRIAAALGIIVALIAVVLVGDAIRRGQAQIFQPGMVDNSNTGGGNGNGQGTGDQADTMSDAGAVPIYLNGDSVANFAENDLDNLEEYSFIDDEAGKTQRGWLLRDVLNNDIDTAQFTPDTQVTVSSSARDKSITLTWADVDDPDHMVMFDLSGRGTVKLVSQTLPDLDTRAEWIQDVDRIAITTE
jgi:hypothetical protein